MSFSTLFIAIPAAHSNPVPIDFHPRQIHVDPSETDLEPLPIPSSLDLPTLLSLFPEGYQQNNNQDSETPTDINPIPDTQPPQHFDPSELLYSPSAPSQDPEITHHHTRPY